MGGESNTELRILWLRAGPLNRKVRIRKMTEASTEYLLRRILQDARSMKRELADGGEKPKDPRKFNTILNGIIKNGEVAISELCSAPNSAARHGKAKESSTLEGQGGAQNPATETMDLAIEAVAKVMTGQHAFSTSVVVLASKVVELLSYLGPQGARRLLTLLRELSAFFDDAKEVSGD